MSDEEKVQIEIVHPDGRIEVVDVDAMREEEAKAWDSLDPELQRKAIDYLLTALPSVLKDKLRAKIAMGGDWPAFLLCVSRQRADGSWYWDYCPDCGKRGGHESCGIRCG